jgi:hypothetical protein
MIDGDSSGPITVTDPKAGRVLTDLRQYAFLEPFFGQEKSVGEVATELDLRVDAVFYRVKRYRELGILRIARTALRGGREINLYTAAPSGYFVPLENVPVATLEEWLQSANAYFEPTITEGVSKAVRDLTSHGTPFGLRITDAGAGKISVELSTPTMNVLDELTTQSGPAVLNATTSLRLDYEDAKNLQRSLLDLLNSYRGHRGSQQYFVRLGLARVERD